MGLILIFDVLSLSHHELIFLTKKLPIQLIRIELTIVTLSLLSYFWIRLVKLVF